MNRLDTAKRATILNMLVEGSSLRSISGITGASVNTITKLLVDAGEACIAYHDEHVRGVNAERIQVDEIWQFCHAKERNVETAKAAPEGAGDTWTWTALDADSKLILSWLLGQRDGLATYDFMMDLAGRLTGRVMDLAGRLTGRVQLTSDGLKVYEGAVEDAFGANVDYAQLVKVFGDNREKGARYSPAKCKGAFTVTVQGEPDPAHVNTAYVERHNLTMRMSMRRFTRLTNAFGKKIRNHLYALALYFVHYNFCRVHKTLRTSPAMAAGLTDTLHDAEWIVGLIDANAPTPAKPGPKPGTKYRPRKSD